jgi:hypothetical protein
MIQYISCWSFSRNYSGEYLNPGGGVIRSCIFIVCGLGWVGVVGKTTRNGSDGPGIKSRWVPDIPHPSTPLLEPTSLLCSGYRVAFPGVKCPGRGVDHPFPCCAEFKERVELYMSRSGLSWPILE